MNAGWKVYLLPAPILALSVTMLPSPARAQGAADGPHVTAEAPPDPKHPKQAGDPRKPLIHWSGFKGAGPFVVEIKNPAGKVLFFGGDATATDHYQYDGNDLAVGQTYTIRVVSTGAGVKEEGSYSYPVPGKAPSARSVPSGFFLRKSFDSTSGLLPDTSGLSQHSSEPAAFSFQKEKGKDLTFNADFAVGWEDPVPIPLSKRSDYVPTVSLEGRVGSVDSTENALRLRLGALFNTTHLRAIHPPNLPKPVYFPDGGLLSAVVFKYETDQEFGTKKAVGEVLLQPYYFPLAMGQFQRSAHRPAVQFTWQPTVGVNAGATLDRGNTKETDSTVLRALARGHALLRFNRISRNQNPIQSIDLFADDSFYLLPLEKRDSFNFVNAGVIFNFTDRFSFTVDYKAGADAPDFKKIDTFRGAIGVKF